MQPGRTGRRAPRLTAADSLGNIETVSGTTGGARSTDPEPGRAGGQGTEGARGGGDPGGADAWVWGGFGATDYRRSGRGGRDISHRQPVLFLGRHVSRVGGER